MRGFVPLCMPYADTSVLCAIVYALIGFLYGSAVWEGDSSTVHACMYMPYVYTAAHEWHPSEGHTPWFKRERSFSQSPGCTVHQKARSVAAAVQGHKQTHKRTKQLAQYRTSAPMQAPSDEASKRTTSSPRGISDGRRHVHIPVPIRLPVSFDQGVATIQLYAVCRGSDTDTEQTRRARLAQSNSLLVNGLVNADGRPDGKSKRKDVTRAKTRQGGVREGFSNRANQQLAYTASVSMIYWRSVQQDPRTAASSFELELRENEKRLGQAFIVYHTVGGGSDMQRTFFDRDQFQSVQGNGVAILTCCGYQILHDTTWRGMTGWGHMGSDSVTKENGTLAGPKRVPS
ncbi:hypothetical protein BDW22DRAFT_1341368 [Trametopsis cervina]|nr:hypothetical protein BDW22DRAFT_1341368 [Trametopsis cervina]